ncbi:MAG: tetratricopeptide repeat protein [bacterium]|nr:tetratricopeptide repeat protein [bacterium]
MLASGLIVVFLLFLIFAYPPILAKQEAKAVTSPRYDAQMKKLWLIAQDSMKQRKPLRAEKALLTILKFDEKNAAAYNRLGILYAKEEKFNEAIECFEIAQSLDNNPSTLHNAGLIYLEIGEYEKAAMALEQALGLEGGVASRYLALAKALEKLGRRAEAIDALESAYEIDAATPILRQILALYEASGDQEGIENTRLRLNNQLAALEKKQSLEKARKKAHFIRLSRRSPANTQPKMSVRSKPKPAKPEKAPRRTIKRISRKQK